MPEYIISFRTHGPSTLSSFGEIGNTSIRQGTDHSARTGTIDFHIEAENESDAKEIARNDLQLEGQKIADILSFIAGDGLTLGRFYDPIRAEGSMQQRVDSTTTIGDLIIRIADSIYESTDVTLNDDNHTRRALTWYNLGLSTEGGVKIGSDSRTRRTAGASCELVQQYGR
jgi:hypothetical protein